MSIDLIDSSLSSRTIDFHRARVRAAVGHLSPSPIVHLVLLFGGWGNLRAGDPLAAAPGTGTASLLDRVQALRVPTGRVIARAWSGVLTGDDRGVDAAFDLVARSFHPLGKLIVYGYSAGGVSALRFATRLGIDFPYYNVIARRFDRNPSNVTITYSPYEMAPRYTRSPAIFGYARIDRLITVDIAAGPASGGLARYVDPSVRYNTNIYQTWPSGVGPGSARFPGSHGGPAAAVDPSATRVTNDDWSGRYRAQPDAAHGSIDGDSNTQVLTWIRQELEV